MRARGERHLMWVHYIEPHDPYVRHPELDLGDSDEQRYQSELAYVDLELGALLRVLREEGWYEDSLIAVFADHGESFGEHEHHHHHYLLYPWLVAVPFALHVPGLAPGPFSGPVHLMDLAPTVLQFVGFPANRPLRGLPLLIADPPAERALLSEEIALTGRHLYPYRAHAAASEAEVLARLRHVEHAGGYAGKLAIAQNGLQLVQHRSSRAIELYDMQRDPRAENDLVGARPEAARALSDALRSVREESLLRSLCEVAQPSAQ
jgi:arylsulfatase A-like enzyme